MTIQATTRGLTSIAILVLLVSLAGCPAPTPGERIKQLSGKVMERGDGVVDLDLSGSKLTDDDINYVHAFCSNSKENYKSIHSLNLSDTSITDKTIDFILMQSSFGAPQGLKVLDLSGTKVTDMAINEFKEKYPDCEVKK